MAIGINKVQTDPALSSNSKYSDNLIDKNGEQTAYMDFDSYLKLLAAQMSNQDFNNPMSDSEFLAQMASYSTLEAINKMSSQSALQYGASLTGKTVTVSDGSNFEMGIVDSVTLRDGKAHLMINGSSYEADKVTDVVSDTIVAIMNGLRGTEVSFDTGSDYGKGVVTGGLVANGEQYLVLEGNKVIALKFITLPSGDNAQEVVDDAQKSDGVEPVDGTDESAAENAVLDGSDTSVPAASDSDDLIDGESTPAVEQLLARSEINSTNALTGTYGGFYIEDDTVEETRSYDVEKLSAPAYSESFYADTINANALAGTNTATRMSLGLGNGTVSMDDYLKGSGQADPTDDDLEGNDLITNSTTNTTSTNNVTSYAQPSTTGEVSDTVRFTSPYPNTIYTNTNPGVKKADDPIYRKYGYEYPAEAALADALGTRMFDIRFITNTAITSRIDTSEIIGYSATGRALTEIGFSGQGRLGEVNTYADGTQRVEIINKNGKNGWYYTTGRYTIDQIIDRKHWIKDLSQAESDIRHFAEQYSADEINFMNDFENYIAGNF
jgi:flagellar basal-body rod modification protein FlgD